MAEQNKITKEEVVKKQAEFIESFQKLLGGENSQTVNAIITPLRNTVSAQENKINILTQKEELLKKENEALKKHVEELTAKINTIKTEINSSLATKEKQQRKELDDFKNNNLSLIKNELHKIKEVVKAIGNICGKGI